MNVITVALAVACIVTSGCSGSSSSTDEMPGNGMQQDEVTFVGTYDLTATSSTQFGSDGGSCGDASGTMTISNSTISGTVYSTTGNTYVLNGNVNSNGQISGGFAVSGEEVASFDGVISSNSGSGNWSDNFGCTGTWDALLSESVSGDASLNINSELILGDWIQVNFLGDDDNGEWDSDDLSGLGFFSSISASEWVLFDESGCTVTYSYQVESNGRYSTSAKSINDQCPFLVGPHLNESGTLEFTDQNRFMNEYFDVAPGDTLLAFRWMRL